MGCGPRSLVFPLPSLKFKFIMTQSLILIPILMKVHFPFLILIADYPNHIKVWPIQDQSVSISPHFPNYISLFCLRLPSTYRSQFVLAKFQLKKKKKKNKKKKKKTTIDSQLIFRETQFQLCFFCIAMESISAAEKQNMVSLFLEIAVGQSAETARQFLQATSWKLEEAIQLFYIGNEGGLASSSLSSPPIENVPPVPDQNLGKEVDVGNANVGQDVGNEEVRPPLPVKREVLYDDASLYRNQRMGSSAHEANSVVAFRNFDEELKRPGIWESDQNGASTTDSSRDNLASLYRPPFALMHQGPFEKAKTEAAVQDKWLLVNLQSTKEFSSHMLNRDTWANEAVAQTISTNFIFWQVYDDTSEGRKVCTYYNLVSIPVILVIDPITGQKMRSWNGMIQPESLLEDLLPFMDRGPKDHHVVLPHKRPRESAPTIANKIKARLVATDEVTKEEDEEISQALAASMEDVNAIRPTPIDDEKTDKKPEVGKEAETYLSEKPNYPTLPEEPKGDRSLLCRVRVRLPDGRTCQRNFLRSDPIQLLWSFCSSQLDEGETRQFRLMQAIPGASNSLDYKSKLTFEESGLSNSVVSVTWK